VTPDYTVFGWQKELHQRHGAQKRAPFCEAGIYQQSTPPRPRQALMSLFERIFRAGVELVYPPQCIICETATIDAFALCPRCWQKVPFIAKPFCERLGTPFAVDYGMNLLSPAAIADPPRFDHARAVALHHGIARDLVARLKYGERLDLAPVLARMMAGAGRDILHGADALIPVPMHRARLWQRRYNQSALLAQEIEKITHIPVLLQALSRPKSTRAQVGLTRTQRRSNLAGAFAVPDLERAKIAGKHVILIDDVRTTGSTLNASAHILRQAGAARIDALTFTLVV
jgi:ComF family protein